VTYTTDDLIKSVKRGITVPNYQALLSDDDILLFATEEMLAEMSSIITSLRSEFFVWRETTPIVAGQEKYDIPYRAVGRTLRDLIYKVGTYRRNLGNIAPEDSIYWRNNGTGGDARGFMFEGDKIILLPASNNSQAELEITYILRPNKFTQISKAARVQSVNTTTNTIVTQSTPPDTFQIGVQLDILQNKQGVSMLGFDKTLTNVSGTTLTFSSIPEGISQGDWLSLSETTPILQIPEEGMQLLAQMTQCRVLEALGDTEGLQVAENRKKERIKSFQKLLTPRNEGELARVVPSNGLLNRTTPIPYRPRIS